MVFTHCYVVARLLLVGPMKSKEPASKSLVFWFLDIAQIPSVPLFIYYSLNNLSYYVTGIFLNLDILLGLSNAHLKLILRNTTSLITLLNDSFVLSF